MDKYLREYCEKKFETLFSENINYLPKRCKLLNENDYKELIDEANKFADSLSLKIKDERWMEYMIMIEYMVSSRNIKSKTMFMGVVALNNLTFLWDDLSDDIVKKEYNLAINEAKRLIKKYYEDNYYEYVFDGTKQWIDHDTFLRKLKIKNILFSKSIDTYWSSRLIDSGTHYWIIVSSPIYNDEQYLKIASLMIPSQLTLKGYMFINDVFSYNREKEQKEIVNCLYHVNINNKDEFEQFFQKHLKQIIDDIEIIKSLPEISKDILLDSLYGHYNWAKNTIRYDIKGINDINKRIEVDNLKISSC